MKHERQSKIAQAHAASQALEVDVARLSRRPDDLSGAAANTLGQARLVADCGADAFYIEGGRIQLCPEVCSSVRGEEGARVDVLFGCESTIIVR